MSYNKLSKEVEQLSYRDKFRLAQLLIQMARKEEEEAHPEQRQTPASSATLDDPNLIQYVAERLLKLKPSKKEALLNSIGAMFQFQGGISDQDKERIFSELHKARHIDVAKNGRIQYPETSCKRAPINSEVIPSLRPKKSGD